MHSVLSNRVGGNREKSASGVQSGGPPIPPTGLAPVHPTARSCINPHRESWRALCRICPVVRSQPHVRGVESRSLWCRAVLGCQLCRLAALTFVNFAWIPSGRTVGLSSFNRRAAAVLLAELSRTEPALTGAYDLLYSPPRRTHPLGTRRFCLQDCKIDTKPASQR